MTIKKHPRFSKSARLTLQKRFYRILVREMRQCSLIDYSVESGPTISVIACNLKKQDMALVIGFGLVGSLKGFDEIREVWFLLKC